MTQPFDFSVQDLVDKIKNKEIDVLFLVHWTGADAVWLQRKFLASQKGFV